jgi:hypothetical protein
VSRSPVTMSTEVIVWLLELLFLRVFGTSGNELGPTTNCNINMVYYINRHLFTLNSDIHNIGTRYNNDFHLPSAQSKLFLKGVFYSAIKMYNHLPLIIKELSYDVKRFRRVLKRFIHSTCFYSLEEYFDFNW